MATTSQVKSGLDAITEVIKEAHAVIAKAQSNTSIAVADLNALPTDYADVLATINAYGTVDAFEALSKAELAKLTTEFMALVTAGTTIVNTDID
jgi:hypothetical protein